MANELAVRTITGLTLYTQRTNAANAVWDGDSYVTPVDADWSDYVVAMTESENTGWYYGDDPDPGTPGSYTVFRQLGGSPATTDPTLALGDFGTDLTELAEAVDTILSASHGSGLWNVSVGSTTTIIAPVDSLGNVTIIIGDTYNAAEDRVPSWDVSLETLDLTDATVTINLLSNPGFTGTPSQTFTATVTNAGQSTQTISLPLTKVETSALLASNYYYEFEANYPNTHKVTFGRSTARQWKIIH